MSVVNSSNSESEQIAHMVTKLLSDPMSWTLTADSARKATSQAGQWFQGVQLAWLTVITINASMT